MPNTYDSLQIGDSHTWRRLITAEDVQAFADLTGDDNPLHLDPAYAATTPFGRPVAHGVFLLGLASKVMGRDFPGPGSIAVSLSAKFLRPVPVGEEVTIEIKVAEKIERFGHVKLRLYAYVGGKLALGGEATVVPPSA
jgi:acyl dehydratase